MDSGRRYKTSESGSEYYDPKNISNGLLEALDYIDYYFYGNQELYKWFEKRFYILRPGNKEFDDHVNRLLDFIKK